MTLVESHEIITTATEASSVSVRRAHAPNAASNWAMNQGAYLANAPLVDDDPKISELPVLSFFADPRTSLVGKNSRDWHDMITDKSGNQAVFNAWIDYKEDADGTPVGSPAGMVRAYFEGDERWIGSLRVGNHVSVEDWGDVFSLLYAAAQDWHEHEDTRIMVPESDQRLQEALGQGGFRFTGGQAVGVIAELEMVKHGR